MRKFLLNFPKNSHDSIGLISSVFSKTDKNKRIAIFYLFNDVVQHAHLKLQENGEMKHFLEHVKSTLETSGEDVKPHSK